MNALAAARADATLLAVLRRAASPLRHDMAGAVLVPRMRLQMLRRQVRGGVLAADALQARIDEVIAALDAVSAAQRAAMAWFEQHDDNALALGDALAHITSTLGLAAGERGLRIDWRGGSAATLRLPAQPLAPLLYAGCFHALDHAPGGSVLAVVCERAGEGACVDWRYESPLGDEGESAVPPVEARLDSDGVAALCARFGARFELSPTGATLTLAGVGA